MPEEFAQPQRLLEARLSKTGAEMLFEVFSLRYERGATRVTSNLPFNEWTEGSALSASPAPCWTG